ncbi:MAG: hypothetical protein ACYTCN_09590, partial [Planctomycetota bacterium]
MSFYGVPPIGADLRVWAEKFTNWIQSTRSFLTHRRAYDSAAEDGVLLWDRTYGYPVVSKNGEWRQIVLEDGHYDGTVSTNQTAASINTAYALTFTQDLAEGIANGTPASRLVVTEAGQYSVTYSMQMASTSAATVTMWFW